MSRLRYNYDYVLRLIERGAVKNINTDLQSTSKLLLLHLAVWNGDGKLVTFLLQNGADINVNHLRKGTPLHIAVAMGNLEIVKILIKFGADIHRQLLSDPWHTPLHMAVSKNNIEIVEFLLKNGGNVNIELDCRAPPYYEKGLLRIAVRRSYEKMVKLLLKYNVNVNADIFGNSKHINTAVYIGNVAIMKLLIAHGADVNGSEGADSDVFPPLVAAATKKNLEVLELLLNNDMIQVNRVTKSNYTALHYGALCSDHCDMIQRLLDAGVDVNLENDKGQTALDLIRDETSKVKCTIRKHIVKLCVANFYVSPGNLAAVDSKAYKKLRNECTTEIEMMKKVYIGTSNLNFYDVLHKSRHVLASRLKYISDESILSFDTTASFPQYAGMINFRLKKALTRKKMLLNTSDVIHEIFNELRVPAVVIRKIIEILTHKDLQKLIPH